MEKNDTIKLLKECDAGTKMGISAIDEILDKVQNKDLITLLEKSKQHHQQLESDIREELRKNQSEEKEPNPMAKSMSWLKTNMKMSMDNSDATIADLLTDGCNMGVKSLHKYLNQYPAADSTSKGICKRLLDIETELCNSLTKYL
jgi:hypothetical protein